MGRDEDEGVAEDGGWGEMIDHGHDLAEYMLDTPHPYDLHGHKPADKWGTRQQLVSQRFADPGSEADEGRLPAERRIVSSGRARPPRPQSTPRQRTQGKPARPAAPSAQPAPRSLDAMKVLGTAPFKDNPKGRMNAARAALAGRRLSMDPDDVAAIVTCGLPSKQIADTLSLTLKQVKAVHREYNAAADAVSIPSTSSKSRAAPLPAKKTSGAPKAKAGSTRRTGPPLLNPPANPPVARRPISVPSIPGCGSCGAPIGFNGRCQCS